MIEIQFGFESNLLDLGRLNKGETVTKSAFLIVKDESKRRLVELSSASAHIAFKMVGPASGQDDRIGVEVTVLPEIVPGRLSETIAATLTDGSYPASNLAIRGTIVGNVEVTPEAMRFTIDTSQADAGQGEQRVRIAATREGARFDLLSVSDIRDQLSLKVDTVESGTEYVVRAQPKEQVLEMRRNISGDVRVRTSDQDQPEVTFRYTIVFIQ